MADSENAEGVWQVGGEGAEGGFGSVGAAFEPAGGPASGDEQQQGGGKEGGIGEKRPFPPPAPRAQTNQTTQQAAVSRQAALPKLEELGRPFRKIAPV